MLLARAERIRQAFAHVRVALASVKVQQAGNYAGLLHTYEIDEPRAAYPVTCESTPGGRAGRRIQCRRKITGPSTVAEFKILKRHHIDQDGL